MSKSFSNGPDLFGLVQQPKRTNDRPESAALVEVLKALRAHPAVVWVERINSGVAKVGGRFIRFGWPGCSDLLGMLLDGRTLAVEVKSQSGKLRPAQAVFLDRVNAAGGVAFMARDLRDVHRLLELATALATVPLVVPAHVVSDVTRVRDRDLDPAYFDESSGEFFTPSPPPVRQHQKAVHAALAGLKGKVDIANESCHDLNAHPHGLPQHKGHTAPNTKCNPSSADKQNTLDF